MLLEYSTPEAASFAVEKLNGFEYPINEPIMMKPEKGWLVSLVLCNVVNEYFYPYYVHRTQETKFCPDGGFVG